MQREMFLAQPEEECLARPSEHCPLCSLRHREQVLGEHFSVLFLAPWQLWPNTPRSLAHSTYFQDL